MPTLKTKANYANRRRRAKLAEPPPPPEPKLLPDQHCATCPVILVREESRRVGQCLECRLAMAARMKEQARRVYKGGSENVGKTGRVLYRVRA